MKRIYRKNNKGVIILKGIKYLLLVTIVLFAVVFVVTRFGKKNDSEMDLTETSAVTEETTSKPVVEEDNVNIDNKWAMFLVNNQNPLPENYDDLIETALVFEDYREYYMDARMADYIIRMIEDAKKDGIDLLVVSSYRTLQYQKDNFDSSVQKRMDEGMNYEDAYVETSANVAFPGKSEHNAGLAADIMCKAYTSMDDDGFENTPEFEWLSEHAAEYGFILRYPKGKINYTGIIYEPWHFRFVGVYYANELKKLGMCLEEYYEYRGWLDENGTAIYMCGPVELENKDGMITESSADNLMPTETKISVTVNSQSEQHVSIIV